MRSQITFLLALWKANLLSAMEYRVAFLTQVIGMMLNNGVYFLIWVIFFDRFDNIRGWGLNEMMLLFGVVACGFGLGVFLFGNTTALASIIAKGQLDYYLSLPRPVLIHVISSNSVTSGLGDFSYGILSFLAARQFSAITILRFGSGVIISTVVFVSFLVLVQSLAFWLGNAELLGQQAVNAVVTFSLYPINLFDGTAKLLLFTVIPAAFIGAVPAELIVTFSWERFALLLAAAAVLLVLAVITFYRGLQRYESGSAIQSQI